MSDKWLSKVEALIAKANSPAATPEEAESFLAKAQELMTKFNIEDAMLRAATQTREPVKNFYIPLEGQYRDAQATLWHWIAKANSCRVGWQYKGGSGKYGITAVSVFGTQSNIDMAKAMFAGAMIQMVRTTLKQTNVSRYDSTRAFRASFANGWAHSVGKRLMAIYKTTADTEPGAGLVLLDESQRVEQVMADAKRGEKFEAHRPTAFSPAGYSFGSEAGKNAPLGGHAIKSHTPASLAR